MSRSKKKNPIYKDRGCTTYNRTFRRKNRIRLSQLLYNQDTVFVLLDEAVNQYDICDYIFRDLDKYQKDGKTYKAWLK